MDRNDQYCQKFQSNSTPSYYNQTTDRSSSSSNRNERSFSHDNYRNENQNRPGNNRNTTYDHQLKPYKNPRTPSRDKSRDSNPRVKFSDDKIQRYFSDNENGEINLN